ncbi:MAG: FAD-dependent oxidoreductase [Nocardioidaceae bacterium]
MTSPSPVETSAGLVVVGGGPAGLSAARAYREGGGRGRVLMVSADRHPPYNRPPLSKDFLRGESEASALPLEDPSFYGGHEIELLLARSVAGLDLSARSVVLDDGERVPFLTVVLATGRGPAALPVPGGDHPALRFLRSRHHGEQLRDAVASAGRVVVVGSGFIGCEAAVSLAARGTTVTMVSPEPLPQQERLGAEVGERIAGWLREAGVRLLPGRSVIAVEDGRRLLLDDGSTCEADLVLVSTGAAPQGELALEAGLATSEGRVVVDSHMRTQVPGVLAAGDIAFAHNDAAGRSLAVEHWGEALRMGEVAGTTAAGGDDTWAQVPGFWSEIGERTLKYAAWGDGHDDVRVVDHRDGGFTAWYSADGVLVGVLTHDADDDYEEGQSLVEKGAPSETS